MVTIVDVGCMRVHQMAYGGLSGAVDMLDPVQNADYAAGFLLDLHEAHQSWDDAVKHYHSAEPEKNVRYHSRVLAELEIFLADNRARAADDPAAVAGVEAADLELASLTAPSPVSDVMPAPVAPPAPPLPFPLPVPAPFPMDQPISQPIVHPMISGEPTIDVVVPDAATPDASAKTRQPNLAPHWNRVEKFRALLARQAG